MRHEGRLWISYRWQREIDAIPMRDIYSERQGVKISVI